MPTITAPSSHVHASFLAAMEEFRAEGRGDEQDHSLVGEEIRRYGDTWDDPGVFAEYLTWLHGMTNPANLPQGWVPSRTLWWADGTEYLGRITLRAPLTEKARLRAGHIGYDVRPGARRRGHATAMLAAILPMAAETGLERVTIVCAEDNRGSIGTIEANGGVLDTVEHGHRRYLVPTRT